MNLLSKTLLASISFLIFIFLIFVTYLVSSYGSLEKPFYEKSKLGLYGLSTNDKGIITVGDVSDNTDIFINNINNSDKVIFSSGSISTKTASGNIILSITPGIYYFDLKEINSNYIISGNGFEIDNKGPGSFFVNSIDPKKNIVFSMNNISKLNLKNIHTNEDVTSIDLYPHTYLLFNPFKNIFVKNSDLLKISQTFNLGYFNEHIFIEDNINTKLIDFITLKNELNKKVVTTSLLLGKQELKSKKLVIDNFINSNFGTLAGEQVIEKYILFLKNPNKKSIYYKNLIIRNLHKLIKSPTLDILTIDNIIDYSIKLKEIDSESYKEIENIIFYYYSSNLKNNPEITSKINLSQLVNKLQNNNKYKKYSFLSLLKLEKTFFENDYIGNNNFYNEIALFKKEYFKDLNVITKGNSTNKSNTQNIKNIDYLLFFLENILVSDFSSSSEGTEKLIKIFSDYIDLANSFYSNSNEKIKRTGIFTYSKILNNFVDIIKSKYFTEDRNKNGLLILNENENLSNEEILNLEDNIDNIFGFYKNFIVFLSPESNNKDKFVIKQYKSLETKFKEYFSALKDYEEYSSKYDKNKNELLTTNTVNENNNDIVLNKTNAINYLKTFNGIFLGGIEIKMMDYSYCVDPSIENEKLPVQVVYCYKIENINIDGNNTSFLLFPFEKNKIDEIVVEGQKKSGSYKLDEIEEILKEKISTVTKDKDKYEFSNFLINTFGKKIYVNSNENSSDNNSSNTILEEDSVVKIFKRNKLLGSEGDFAHLSGFLDINYNDLIVKNIGNSYSINIKTGKFNIDLDRIKNYYGEFSSKYLFNPEHSFVDPKVKIIDKKNEKDLLLGNYVYIIGRYKVNLIQEEIKKVFEKYSEMNYIVNNISQILGNNQVEIMYFKDTEQLVFKTNYNNKIINIIVKNGYIISFKLNNVNQIGKETHYNQIQNILNKIK